MDVGDRGQALADKHLETALATHDANQQTGDVERRVNGRYICIDCEDDIPAARVRALHLGGWPASRCIHCQRIKERR